MQPEPMKQAEEQMRELDARIVEALERAPRVIVPEGFAARVAARVPAQRVSVYRRTRIKASRYGMGAAVAGLIVLAIVMLTLAPRVQDNGAFWKAMEWTFCAQFCVLAAWLGLGRRGVE